MELFMNLSIKWNYIRELIRFSELLYIQPLTLNIVKMHQADAFIKAKLLTVLLLLIQFWLPTMALKKTSNVGEFSMENQRTHMSQNYVVQRALKDENPDSDNIGIAYTSESLSANTSPDELPALIVDYANMIRNDIILLDNSIETRTRKRGNVKVEKHTNGGLKEIPCNCEQENTELLILGDDYVPSFVETRKCSPNMCSSPYSCQRRIYHITVLKRKKYGDKSSEELPEELTKRWIALKKPITIGCFCTADYREHY